MGDSTEGALVQRVGSALDDILRPMQKARLVRWYYAVLSAIQRDVSVSLGDITVVVPKAAASDVAGLLGDESELVEDLSRELSDDSTFWDVGAHYGSFTAVAGLTAKRVVAFEPHPGNATLLRRVVALNGHGDRTDVHQVALGARDTTSGVTAGGTVFRLDATSAESRIDVYNGTDYARRHELPVPTVVKIDVEGAELSVVEGLSDLLHHDDCRTVYCEVHRTVDDTVVTTREERDAFRDRLTECGFSLTTLFEKGNNHCLKAVKE